MTEREWNTCDDPEKMLKFLGKNASKRKLQLFSCACCYCCSDMLDGSANAVRIVEEYADAPNRSPEQLDEARAAVSEELDQQEQEVEAIKERLEEAENAAESADEALTAAEDREARTASPAATRAFMRAEKKAAKASKIVEEVGGEFAFATAYAKGAEAAMLATEAVDVDNAADVATAVLEAVKFWTEDPEGFGVIAAYSMKKCQAVFIRCIFGNPFRKFTLRDFPSDVKSMAEDCYAAFPQEVSPVYGILADRLTQLGEEQAAAHCRETFTTLSSRVLRRTFSQPESIYPGGLIHAKGCHVLDWILGRE